MKTPKVVVQQRVEDVLQLKLIGAQFAEIRRYVAEREAGKKPPWTIPKGGKPVSERTLWRYLQQADSLIARGFREGRKRALRRHLAQRQALFARCLKASDFANARLVLADEAQLAGLYPATKTEVTGKGGSPIYPPLEAMVAALVKAEKSGAQTDAPTDGGNRAGERGPGDGAPAAGSEAVP
jgi:hypothetical protein